MRRHELSDEQYELLEPFLPKPGPAGGRPWAEHRRILNGLFWKLHTGAQWRDVAERYGPWKTIHDRYRRWCQEGRCAAMLIAVRDTLAAQGHRDGAQGWVDSTSIRASRAAAGARKNGGRTMSQPTTPSGVPEVVSRPRCLDGVTVLASHAVSCCWLAKRTNRHTLQHAHAALKDDGGPVANAGVRGVWEEPTPSTHNASATGCMRREAERCYRREPIARRSADEGGQ